MSYQKPYTIRNLDSKDTAQDIDSNFDAIFATLRALQNQISLSATTAAIDGIMGRDGFPGIQGEDGEDGFIGPPGPRGEIGAGGAAGPPTLGPMGIDGMDGDDGFPIPGPRGEIGVTGATGPTGPFFPAFWIVPGEDGDDGYPVPGPIGATGATGAGASWTLVEARTVSGSTTVEDFIGLSAYSEILVIFTGVTKANSGLAQIELSTDNGSTFLTSSGDYLSMNTAGSGATSNQTNILGHSSSTTSARSGWILIECFNEASTYKIAHTTSALPEYIIPNTTAFNALRFTLSAGGNITAGTIYVLGR